MPLANQSTFGTQPTAAQRSAPFSTWTSDSSDADLKAVTRVDVNETMSGTRRNHDVSSSALLFSTSTSGSINSTPSQLWFQTSKHLVSEDGISHPDDLVQEALYALSVQPGPDNLPNHHNDILTWLWQQLQSKAAGTSVPPPPTSSTLYEWWAGTQLLSKLADKMTPFELHGCVVEAIDYCVDSDQVSPSFVCLCLLLCTLTLKQRPQPQQVLMNNETIRWKRWQSLVCETIRLFQRYACKGSLSMDSKTRDALWMQHVLPACRHVVKVLPADTGLPQVALMAGMIGTSTHLLVQHSFSSSCRFISYPTDRAASPEQEQMQRRFKRQCEKTILDYIKCIGPVMGYRYERWIWCHPWRAHYEAFYHPPDNDQVQWLARKNDMGWWTEHASRHELAAGMNTSWNSVGVACMAVFGFDYRPLVLSPHHIWTLWFPHVAILLLDTTSATRDEEVGEEDDGMELDDAEHITPMKRQQPKPDHQLSLAFRTDLAIFLLEKLLKFVPKRSLTLFDADKISRKDALKRRRPDHPIGTFQLLSNLVVAEACSQQQPHEEHAVLQKKVLSLMNALLAIYEPAHQVYIIDELIQNCPHQGFECKLFDMLRPLVSRYDSPDVLWKYLDKVVDDISDHVVEAGETCQLIEVDTLIDKVEIYVSLMTMLQLWLMVHFESPRVDMSILFSFSRALKASLQRWSQMSTDLPPDDYYRLYLLDSVLDQVLQLEESVKPKKQPIIGPAPPPEPTYGVESMIARMGSEQRSETPTSQGYRAQTPTMGVPASGTSARSPPRNTPSNRSSRSSTPTMSTTSTSSRSKSQYQLNNSSNLMAPLLNDQNASSETKQRHEPAPPRA